MPFLCFLCQYLHITVLAYLFAGYLPSKTACQNPQEYSAVSPGGRYKRPCQVPAFFHGHLHQKSDENNKHHIVKLINVDIFDSPSQMYVQYMILPSIYSAIGNPEYNTYTHIVVITLRHIPSRSRGQPREIIL